jgi:uncharacterized protein (DUF2062 family)
MNENKPLDKSSMTSSTRWKQRVQSFLHDFKTLQGDPNYIAKGIAIGVFVGITPTIPLHTAIALAISFVFKASKPAAVIGVWVGNPVTVPFFYIWSYKIGTLILGKTATLKSGYWEIQQLLKLGLDTTLAMILGGVILGILPTIASYFVSLKIFTAIHERKIR